MFDTTLNREASFVIKGHLPRVFIGYDPRETVAVNVLTESIQSHASLPVQVVPGVNYVGGSRQLRRRVGAQAPAMAGAWGALLPVPVGG